MSNTYTSRIGLALPSVGDTGWSVPVNGNCTTIDGLAPVGNLAVLTKEIPSTSLNVKVASGTFVGQDGSINTYAGTSSQAITASTTKVLYLDGTASWALTVGTSYPSTPHVRLASVTAGSSSISSITDQRQCFEVVGSWADGVNITLGMTTGTQIASATNQKLGFWGKTPVVQPSGSAQAAMTDSTTGTIGTTLAACTDTTASDQSGTINSNLASLNNLVAAMRTALVNAGLIKGSA